MKERCTDEREILHKSPWINEAVDRISANSDMSELENGFIKALFKKKAFNAKWKRVGSEEWCFVKIVIDERQKKRLPEVWIYAE